MELVIWWVLFGITAGVIAAAKSQNAAGFFLGLLVGILLGPLGVIIVLFVKPTKKKQMEGKRICPHCREPMHAEATVCPHCQRESDPASSSAR